MRLNQLDEQMIGKGNAFRRSAALPTELPVHKKLKWWTGNVSNIRPADL